MGVTTNRQCDFHARAPAGGAAGHETIGAYIIPPNSLDSLTEIGYNKSSVRLAYSPSIYCRVEMERYWLAVLVVAFLALSSTNGASFISPGEARAAVHVRCSEHIFCAVHGYFPPPC